MRSEIARAGMKHKGIIIQYMNPFHLCIMVVVVLVLLCAFICVYMCPGISISVRTMLSFRWENIWESKDILAFLHFFKRLSKLIFGQGLGIK